MASQGMQSMFSLDADLFRQAFEDLVNWIWELWCQYGDENYEFAYFGKEGYEPIRLSKEEVQGKYKLTVRGNDQNTNPQTRLQKAQMILMLQQNPIAVQSGVVTPINIANGIKLALQEMDIPNWQELVMPPEILAQQMQANQSQPKTQDIKIKSKDLTEAELAQLLVQRGMKPDVEGRMLKSEAKIQDKRIEQGKVKTEGYKNIAEMVDMIAKPEEENGKTTQEEAGS
jgi:hypothetical protein